MKVVILMKTLSGAKSVLTGLQGKTIYLKLVAEVEKQPTPVPLFLNLQDVIATGSFFREAILRFRDYCIAGNLNLYPVVANADEETIDELERLLELLPDAIMTCKLDKKENVSKAKCLGVLEEKQQITFEAVLEEKKETDAATLANKYQDIGVTGWNNRLTNLATKGLLIETRKGRSKFYRTVLEVL